MTRPQSNIVSEIKQLVSYIAHAAPATRRPATGNEPFLRPEIGFTPRWYNDATGVTFDERWHTDPAYRRDSIVAMDRIAREYGPCDIVFADIDRGVPDERIHELIDLCEKHSEKYAKTP